ncbi:hypothetical protein M9Y10_000707 [Tritrichomonas musculus]|uniref:Protein kinase domain-containing protein n=1 Tax=Tritrichomonas musculus TaxID=1915356 RepID=A0ABR2I751_9EUKA
MFDSMISEIDIPRHIDGFLIMKKFQDGGFSTLYHAFRNAECFVCKAIKKEKYIGKEIEIQKSLTHDNIEEIIHHCEDSKNIYIFTKLEDESLEEYLEKFGRFGTNYEFLAKIIMQQILEAIRYVHAKGISFCDVKPGNFLMTRNLEIKLHDFGCAVESQSVSETRGTPYYLSPEAIDASQSYDGFASDIWSCGVVLYRMLTGELPYKKARTMTQLRDLIHSVKFELDDEFSASASDLLSKMTQKDPTKRPTAEDALHHNWFE